MGRRRVILDCDPGQDDAVAILLALAAPEAIDLIRITTVAGNVPLPLTQRNALQIVELADRRHVPIHAGCSRPILGPPVTAEKVHGASGLDGVALPEPTLPLADKHGVDAIIDTVMDGPDDAPVTLCALGPLTNIALAVIKEPRIVPRLESVALMGGAMGLGNRTASAEFNFHADPYAAAVVFGSGAPIVMFGLDVTRQVRVSAERLARVRAIGNRVTDAVGALLAFYRGTGREAADGPPLHDPCVIAWLLEPSLFRGRHCRVDIELQSELCRGRSIVDWWHKGGREPNALVMNEADADGFFALLIDRLAKL